MDKQTLHGTVESEELILEIQEVVNGIDLTVLGPHGRPWCTILVDKKEFGDALVTMCEQLDELPF